MFSSWSERIGWNKELSTKDVSIAGFCFVWRGIHTKTLGEIELKTLKGQEFSQKVNREEN